MSLSDVSLGDVSRGLGERGGEVWVGAWVLLEAVGALEVDAVASVAALAVAEGTLRVATRSFAAARLELRFDACDDCTLRSADD